MTKNLTLAAAVAAAGLLIPLSQAVAHDNRKEGKARSSEKFIEETVRGNMAEIRLGQLAAERASSQEVKDFARRMVDDHTKANNDLKEVATRKNVAWPSDVSPKHQSEYDRLSKLSGAEFDRAYMRHMTMHHRKDISKFEKQANKGSDSDVKQYAESTLPTLREHLQMAQRISGDHSDMQHTSGDSTRRSDTQRSTDQHHHGSEQHSDDRK